MTTVVLTQTQSPPSENPTTLPTLNTFPLKNKTKNCSGLTKEPNQGGDKSPESQFEELDDTSGDDSKEREKEKEGVSLEKVFPPMQQNAQKKSTKKYSLEEEAKEKEEVKQKEFDLQEKDLAERQTHGEEMAK